MSDDHWLDVLSPVPPARTQPAFHTSIQYGLGHLTKLAPLTSQDEPSIPARLRPWALDPINGDAAALFAVIDASNIFGLEEMLENSGLEHRCLFIGNAFNDLRTQAPWLVRLEDGNRFTAHMFSQGTAPWFLWRHEAHIFLRARDDLGAVWAHLRRILRFQDNKSRWQMFRFWQQDFMRFCAETISLDDAASNRFFGGGLVRAVFGLSANDTGWYFSNPNPTDTQAMKSADLGPIILPLARRYAWEAFQIKLFENLKTRYNGKVPEINREDVIHVSDTVRAQGYSKENAVADITEAALIARYYGLAFNDLVYTADPAKCLSEATRAKRIKIVVNEAAADLKHGL